MIDKNRVRFTLRIPVDVFEHVENESKEIGITKNSIITKILYEYFNDK